jgi:hypothetical protein
MSTLFDPDGILTADKVELATPIPGLTAILDNCRRRLRLLAPLSPALVVKL